MTALRVHAAGAQSSATVVAGIGGDRRLAIRASGGGRLIVDLLGAFEPAATATSGRVVATRATRVLTLTPARDGNDATVDLSAIRGVPALRAPGAVSAVLLQVSGDVGTHGGYVSLGPSATRLNQSVYWSATAGQDRLRPGFLVVPVRSGRLHVQYHAGLQLRMDLVGFVTGPKAAAGTAGLLVPVPSDAATPARVTADGRVDVTVVPAGGTAGLTPDRVSAALLTLNATGTAPAGVTVGAPDAATSGTPDVQAGRAGRTTLALSPVVDGAVTISSTGPAVVVVTPRVLVIGG